METGLPPSCHGRVIVCVNVRVDAVVCGSPNRMYLPFHSLVVQSHPGLLGT